MPKDPFVRERFTRGHTAARELAQEYFERFPKERYQIEVESWRHLQSASIEFTMKRLRDPAFELQARRGLYALRSQLVRFFETAPNKFQCSP
jgi:hypothetical protein